MSRRTQSRSGKVPYPRAEPGVRARLRMSIRRFFGFSLSILSSCFPSRRLPSSLHDISETCLNLAFVFSFSGILHTFYTCLLAPETFFPSMTSSTGQAGVHHYENLHKNTARFLFTPARLFSGSLAVQPQTRQTRWCAYASNMLL